MAPLPARVLAVSLLAAHFARGTLVAQAPAPATGPDGAFSDCPCIDHASNGSVWAEWLLAQGYLSADGDLRTSVGPAPRDYGSGECLAFDAAGRGGPHSAHCAVPDPLRWCGARWCYVDPAACSPRRMPEASPLLPGLHYSYAACGSINHFQNTAGNTSNALAPLYVYNFGFSVFQGPWPGMSQLDVVITEFMREALQYLGFSPAGVQHRTVSAAGRAAFNSSYTACVHDIAVGHLDLCVGAFWDTFDRRELLAPFASTLISENIYLYVPVKHVEEGFWTMVLKPTKAFSPGLWGLIVAVLLAAGIVMVVLEYGVAEGDFAEHTLAGSVLQSFYLTGMSLVNAGSSFDPRTAAGKVFSLGFGFFILIATASFTANTASILISENRAEAVPDLATALAKGDRVCTPAGMRRTITPIYPLMEEFGVYSDIGIDRYQAGDCDLCLLPEFSVREMQSRGETCELQRVGKPLLSFPTGVFASERLRPALDTAITAKRADGTWYLLEASLQQPTQCPSRADTSGSTELEVQHMTGNCILLGFSLGVATMLHVLQRVHRRVGARIAHQMSSISTRSLRS